MAGLRKKTYEGREKNENMRDLISMGWLGRERFGEADTEELQFAPEMRICREKNTARVQNCPGTTLLTYSLR